MHSPYLGQGVTQAVEDVTALTTVLSMIETKEQLPLAINAYESSRKGRVEQIHAASDQARKQSHLKDAKAQASPDTQRVAASEANQKSDITKIQQSYWVWDAAEVARKALSDLIITA